MLMHRVVAFALFVLVVPSTVWSVPASAQSTASYKAQLDAISIEMLHLWGELDRFQPKKRYCYPPYAPIKAPDQAQMIQLSARVDALLARYNGVKQGLMTFLGNNHRLYAELMINGLNPGDRRWWLRYDNFRDRMVRERTRKQAMLASAPEVNCAPKAKAKPAGTTGTTGTGGQVTAPQPSPPPPVQIREPVPPTYQPVSMPTLPKFFCSGEEKLAFLQSISAESEKAHENAGKAGRYKVDVAFEIYKLEQADQPVPPGLRAQEQRADAEVRAHQAQFDALHRLHQEAAKITVIDCSKSVPQEEPRQDLRTGQTTTVRPPPGPGLKPEDELNIASQQRTIDNFEAALDDLQSLFRQGKCGAAWDLVEDLDDWLDDLDDPRPALNGIRLQPPPQIPTRLINEWDDRIEEIIDDCPRPDRPQIRLDVSTILDLHNSERARFGYEPLRWSIRLSDNAQGYADQLASTGQRLHASREGRGIERENLSQGLLGWGTGQMMASWLAEKPYFRSGIFPDVSTTGDWSKVGHYSQMIWPTTTSIGCGLASGSGFNWLVCRYSPGGNKDGKSVGLPQMPSPRTAVPQTMPQPRGEVARGDIAPPTSSTTVRPPLLPVPGGGMTQIDPPPPPPPTARDDAPEGKEENHPLVRYAQAADAQHAIETDCGNAALARLELEKMRYALDELRKRLKAARKAGPYSAVKPADVQKQIDEMERKLRDAEQRKPRGECPPVPPAPQQRGVVSQ